MMYIHHMAQMVRKQLYLSAQQNQRLQRAAVRLRRTEADLVREALDRHLGSPGADELHIDEDPLWSIVGAATSREGDLSKHVDEHLYGPRRR